MKLSRWVRQTHRWVSALFTVVVVIVAVLSARAEEPPEWVYFTPLPLMGFLLLTGLYLFALPYAARWRAARGSD